MNLASRRLGSVVAGKWTLEALLGEGGLGAVYRAKHKNGSVVAIKILHAERRDARWAKRFEREGRLANKVGHAAIVRVLDDGLLDDGAPFLVSELVDGASLEEERQEHGGTLPLTDVLAVAEVLLAVLAQAHEKGILHRDIKPANLMRATNGEIKVLDFGLARESGEDAEGLTSVDAVMGTVGFMAPEQAQGRWDVIDARTDLWAAGATLLKLATGLDAHDGETAQTRLAFAATRPIEPLATRGAKLPPAIAEVIERAMAFTKAERYADAASFSAALARAARGEPLAGEAQGLQTCLVASSAPAGTFDAEADARGKGRTPTRRARWSLVVAALSLAGVGGLGWLAVSARTAPDVFAVPTASSRAAFVGPAGVADASAAGADAAEGVADAHPQPSSLSPSTLPPTAPSTLPSARHGAKAVNSDRAPSSAGARGSPPEAPSASSSGDPLDRRR